jgi:hypothetical protein
MATATEVVKDTAKVNKNTLAVSIAIAENHAYFTQGYLLGTHAGRPYNGIRCTAGVKQNARL